MATSVLVEAVSLMTPTHCGERSTILRTQSVTTSSISLSAGEDCHDDRFVLLVGVGDIARQQGNLVEQPVESHPVLGDEGNQRRRACRLRDRQVQPRVQPPVVDGLRAADVGQPRPQHFPLGGGQGPVRRHPRGADLEDLAQPQRIVDLRPGCPRAVVRVPRQLVGQECAAVSAATGDQISGVGQ